jgi:Kef-type K+ transport system membrane component KefB
MTIFVELSIIVVWATAVSLAVRFLKQPLIVGYIVAGVLVGPYVFNIIQSHEEIELFSKIGVAILLFIVGLTLNPDVMREVGKVSLITGLGQVVFTSIIGFFIVSSLGFDTLTAIYTAIALTFSSTIIILKLLSDRGDTQKLYGKISIGFLLVQDIVATILLLVITILGSAVADFSSLSGIVILETLILLGKGVLVALLLYIASRFFLPNISRYVAGYQEALFIFSMAWGLGISALFYTLGFSIEIGALAAGVTLAASPFAYEIASRMKPLRDFFIMIFFVLLGAGIALEQILTFILPAIVLSVFVLIGNPLIVFILMNLLGYRTRTAFMAGLTVAQISEFSLILVALGHSFGHLSQEVVSLVTLVGIITISGSTYLILYADKIYSWLKPLLKFITIRKPYISGTSSTDKAEIIIFGYDRVGFEFVNAAKEIGAKYLVVDFNPKSTARLIENNIPYRYGDAEDIEFLEEINFTEAKLIISTIPDFKTNILLVKHYRARNFQGVIITISHYLADTKELYGAGASYVVMPHHLGASHAASLIKTHQFNKEAFEKEKSKHLSNLGEHTLDHVPRKD